MTEMKFLNIFSPCIFRVLLATGLFAISSGLRAQQSGYLPPDTPIGVQICMTCHGSYVQGSEVVGGPNLTGMESWYLRRQLQNFRAQMRGVELDYIPGYEMRETAEVLTDEQIEELVAMIPTWEVNTVPVTVEGDTASGEALYGGCAACHGARAEGNELLGAPALNNRNDWYLLRQLKLFKSGYRGAHPEDSLGGQMRMMLQSLPGDKEMLDVVAYISTL
jgi:cytochrome c553